MENKKKKKSGIIDYIDSQVYTRVIVLFSSLKESITEIENIIWIIFLYSTKYACITCLINN